MRKAGTENDVLKGDLIIRGGISLNEYAKIHHWIKRHYGIADRCEMVGCDEKCKTYHYALIHGCKYEKKRENFMMLCARCHVVYDDNIPSNTGRSHTEETKRLLSKTKTGKKVHSEEHKNNLSKTMSGSGNPMYGVRLLGSDNGFFGKSHNEDTKERIRAARATLSKEDVVEIKKLFNRGVLQKDIAAAFKISRPKVCRIVNNKIYSTW